MIAHMGPSSVVGLDVEKNENYLVFLEEKVEALVFFADRVQIATFFCGILVLQAIDLTVVLGMSCVENLGIFQKWFL